MRVLRLFALAAALVVPAAAANAQVGVYVGPHVGYGERLHWDHRVYVAPYVAPYVVTPWVGPRNDWRRDRLWAHDGRYERGRRW